MKWSNDMTTTTTTRNTENIQTRNRRYQNAKEKADRLNTALAYFSEVVGIQLTNDQVNKLVEHSNHFALLTQFADSSYELYSTFCERHDYKEKEITYLYPYTH
jgi:hypothetical protein